MEDDFSPTRSSSSAPSVDPLEDLIARQDAARAAARDTEQEVEEDETTETETTAERDPGDDHEDDVETAEANTPEDDDEDEEESLQERRQTKRPAGTSKTEDDTKQTQGTDSDDDEDRPLSRKQRGKLIQELRQELEQEQDARRRLEESQKTQREEDERLNKEVERALGSDEQFNKDMDAALGGDSDAQERVRIWKANRDFYKKLVTRSNREASDAFFANYWEQVATLPGITEQTLKAPSVKELLVNVYEAGKASIQDTSAEKIEKLQQEVDTWKGRYRALKPRSGGQTKKAPLDGGGSPVSEQPFDWRRKYFGPDGLPTEEANAIVARYGFEALKDPKLIKAR